MRVIDVNRKKYQMIVELYLRVLWGGRILFKKKKKPQTSKSQKEEKR